MYTHYYWKVLEWTLTKKNRNEQKETNKSSISSHTTTSEQPHVLLYADEIKQFRQHTKI